MNKKKVPMFYFGFNALVYNANGMIVAPILGIVFSRHVPDKTWVVHIHLVLFKIEFGWVDND